MLSIYNIESSVFIVNNKLILSEKANCSLGMDSFSPFTSFV